MSFRSMTMHGNKVLRKKHYKIEDVLRKMLKDLPYYYEFAMRISFWQVNEGSDLTTAGVTANKHGLHFLYCKKFIDSLNEEQVKFLIIHELFHLLWRHGYRTKELDKTKSNVVQDEIINSSILSTIKNGVKLPSDPIHLVPSMHGEQVQVFESLYRWHIKNAEETTEQDKIDYADVYKLIAAIKYEYIGNGMAKPTKDSKLWRPKNQKEMEFYVRMLFRDEIKKGFALGVSIDEHFSDEEKEKMWTDIHVNKIKDNLKNRGIDAGSLGNIIQVLNKPKKNYLKKILKISRAMRGIQKVNPTYTRYNKRTQPHAILKGYRKESYFVNIGVDTSGSMWGSFEKILIPLNIDNTIFRVLQGDTQITKPPQIIKNKKELRAFKVAGGGGTEMMPMINYYAKHHPNDNFVLLTDGWTDTLDFSGIKGKSLIITCGDYAPLTGDTSRVQQIKVDLDDM